MAIEANNPTEVARLTTQSFPDANTRRQGITVLHKAADCGSLGNRRFVVTSQRA